MGISIHYSGCLKTKGVLPKLIEEVKDIAESYKWEYHIFGEEFPCGSFGKDTFDEKAYGICFTPPGSEPLTFTFASNGELISPWMLEYYLKKEKGSKISFGNFTKTHYAGATAHKVIIHLIDYISKKYFRRFKLQDEAQYWETRDEKVLIQNFNYLNACMDSFSLALETLPMNKGEKIDKYLERVFKRVQKNKKK